MRNLLALVVVGVAACSGDGGTPGITITPVEGLTTSESGRTATFQILLDATPTAEVAIELTSTAITEGTVEPALVTFSVDDWDAPRTVVVHGVDDDTVDGDTSYTILTGASSSSDSAFRNIDPPDLTIKNIDDDAAGIAVTPTSGLTTSEQGADATFTIVLATKPHADVSIALSSTRPTEGVAKPNAVSFGADNWNVPQTVTIEGLDDEVADGVRNYAIVTAPAESEDPTYNGFDAEDISVASLDNDTPGITVTPTSGLVTTEGGGAATFTVSLTSQPTSDVTIDLSSSDPSVGRTSTPRLIFTKNDWENHIVIVTGRDDSPPVDDDGHAYTIVTAPATSPDPAYSGRNSRDVELFNQDNDIAGVEFDSDAETWETKSDGVFYVRLKTKPLANVTLHMTSSDPTEGVPGQSDVVIAPDDWHEWRALLLDGVDDEILDGDVAYSLRTSISSSDPAYAAAQAPDLPCITHDDDATITVSPTTGLVTSETGGTASFTVVLDAAPTGDVTIPVRSIHPSEGTVSTDLLTFTTTNWNEPQTVIVTGVDDPYDDGDVEYAVVPGPAQGGGFDGVLPLNVTLKNIDDDTSGYVIQISPAGCGTGTNTTLETTESGGTDCFSIRLSSQPYSDVTIDVTSSDATEGVVSPARLVFTKQTWATPQIVTVTGVDDLLIDGSVSYQIEMAAESNDNRYDTDPADVPAVNADGL